MEDYLTAQDEALRQYRLIGDTDPADSWPQLALLLEYHSGVLASMHRDSEALERRGGVRECLCPAC